MPDPDFGSSSSSAWADIARADRRVGRRVEFLSEIGSTNDRARDALRAGDGDGLVVVADRQLAGRGRLGRAWLSPAGANLLTSSALTLDVAAARAWWLGAASALAVRDACRGEADLQVRWPNDLVTADGLKVAGLLTETQVEGDRVVGAVLGIGINVNWRRSDMPPDIRSAATSLADLAGHDVDRQPLLARLLDVLDGEIRGVEAGVSPQARLQAASWLAGRSIEIETPAGRLVGVAGSISEDGGLVLDGPTVRTTVTVGEVIRVHATAAP